MNSVNTTSLIFLTTERKLAPLCCDTLFSHLAFLLILHHRTQSIEWIHVSCHISKIKPKPKQKSCPNALISPSQTVFNQITTRHVRRLLIWKRCHYATCTSTSTHLDRICRLKSTTAAPHAGCTAQLPLITPSHEVTVIQVAPGCSVNSLLDKINKLLDPIR